MNIKNFSNFFYQPAGFGHEIAVHSISTYSESIPENMARFAIKYPDIRAKQARYNKKLPSLAQDPLLTS